MSVSQFLHGRLCPMLLFAVFIAIYVLVFALFGVPLRAIVYPTLLCALVGTGYLLYEFVSAKSRHDVLSRIKDFDRGTEALLPPAASFEDIEYIAVIKRLLSEGERMNAENEKRLSEMTDYYTVWAHQVKTPIASMRLNLQNEDTDFSRGIELDLQRIEQYVEMALTFLRLGSDSTDFVFRESSLDAIIKAVIRKYKSQFIRRHLSLTYSTTDVRVLTDEKWLSIVIEQVVSNAVKYTNEGGVIISVDGNSVLSVKDTGIGIAPEDLPRVFEKGYTGYNGREDKKASGIGLYLCRRICDMLGCGIRLESAPGEGTTVFVDLHRDRTMLE